MPSREALEYAAMELDEQARSNEIAAAQAAQIDGDDYALGLRSAVKAARKRAAELRAEAGRAPATKKVKVKRIIGRTIHEEEIEVPAKQSETVESVIPGKPTTREERERISPSPRTEDDECQPSEAGLALAKRDSLGATLERYERYLAGEINYRQLHADHDDEEGQK